MRPQRFPLDNQKHREEYLAILKQEIENDQKNLQANRLFGKTGQSNLGRPLDIRTASEKEQGFEINKVSLRELLKKVTSADSASQIVQQLSNDQVRFALNKWPIIDKEMKETYALGVPINVFIAYLNKLVDKYDDAIQVETGLQTTTDLLTNTQLALDLAQPETIAQLRLALNDAKKYFQTDPIRERLNEMVQLLMTPEDIAFYNTLPPEVRATTDVLRTDAYEEFPSNRQLLVSLQMLREALVQEERETLRQALVELDSLLEDANANFPVIQKMRAVIEKYKVGQLPDRPETLAETLDDKDQEEQDALVQATRDRLDQQRILLEQQRLQKQRERAVKRESALKQVEERRKANQLQEIASMGAEDPVEQRIQREASLRALRMAERLAEKGLVAKRVAEIERPKKLSKKAEKQGMGAEDRPPLVAREEELSADRFDTLKKKDKEDIMRDLVLKDPDLIFTIRDRKGKDVQRGVNSPQKATSFASFTNQELNDAYRRYKVSTGRGINVSSKGKIMGHGIAHLIDKKAEKPKLYTPFGRYYIQKMKLDDNILQFKSHSGLQPGSLPTERVSTALANVIHTFLTETPNYEEIAKLTEEDKYKLATVCKKCQLTSPAIPKLKTITQQEDDRFEVLRGQLIAGQDNKQLAKEFKVLMLKMVNEGRVPKRQSNEILHEMLMLGI